MYLHNQFIQDLTPHPHALSSRAPPDAVSALPRPLPYQPYKMGSYQPSEVPQTLPWKIRDLPLQRGKFVSGTRDMMKI